MKSVLAKFMSVVLVACVAACGDTENREGGLDIDPGGIEPGRPAIIPGTYKTTLEIQQDECEPSLSRVVDERDYVPLIKNQEHSAQEDFATMAFMVGAVEPPFMTFKIPNLRRNDALSLGYLGLELNWDYSAPSSPLLDRRWSSPDETVDACPDPEFYANVDQDITVEVADDRSEVRMTIHANWRSFKSCLDRPLCPDHAFACVEQPWLPKEPCQETYVFHFQLIHRCQGQMRCPAGQGFSARMKTGGEAADDAICYCFP